MLYVVQLYVLSVSPSDYKYTARGNSRVDSRQSRRSVSLFAGAISNVTPFRKAVRRMSSRFMSNVTRTFRLVSHVFSLYVYTFYFSQAEKGSSADQLNSTFTDEFINGSLLLSFKFDDFVLSQKWPPVTMICQLAIRAHR
jgi:hypothetical protein